MSRPLAYVVALSALCGFLMLCVNLASADENKRATNAVSRKHIDPYTLEGGFTGLSWRAHLGSKKEESFSAIVLDSAGTSPQLEDQESRRLGLLQAIELSLHNNPSFILERLEPASADQDVLRARAALDTNLAIEGTLARDVEPSGSSLSGSTFTTKSLQGTLSLDKRFSSGTEAELNWDNTRTEQDALFAQISPEYSSTARLSLTQPILRGTRWGRPIVKIKAAGHLARAAFHDYKRAAARQVREVIESYWAQVLAAEEVAVQETSLQLAKRLLEESEAAVSVGVQAPLAVSESRAQVELRREELISARNALRLAGHELRVILGIDFSPSDLAVYEPSDALSIGPVTSTVDESVKVALDKRSEIAAQEARAKSALLNAKSAGNALLPELNLRGVIGVSGLAGDVQQSAFDNSPGIDRFQGDYGDVFDDLGSGDFYDYRVGVSLSYPLENSAARADANRQRIAYTRERLRLRSIKQQIYREVLESFADLESSKERHSAASAAERFSQESLEAANERLRAGLSTTREVLEVQEDLAEAQLTVARAKVDYQYAHADVYRSRGELLEYYGLLVER